MDPCIVVASSCDSIIHPNDIIKGILEANTLPEPSEVVDGIQSYPWHIVTKYYEADVRVCSMLTKTIGTQPFAEAVNAAIICFDSNTVDSLSVVEQWLVFVKEFEADIKILICVRCSDSTKVKKVDAQTWCIQHGFELVELNPEETEDSDTEDDFPETVGIKRVGQALRAHIWPNLVLKDQNSRPTLSGLISQEGLNNLNSLSVTELNAYNAEFSDGASHGTVECAKVAKVKPMPKNIDVSSEENENVSTGGTNSTQAAGTSTEASGDNSNNTNETRKVSRDERIDTMLEAMESMPEDTFETLFQNLSDMKSKAESLSPRQRKVYAEKMAIAFWKTLGGNDSEVDGLSSDDEGANNTV